MWFRYGDVCFWSNEVDIQITNEIDELFNSESRNVHIYNLWLNLCHMKQEQSDGIWIFAWLLPKYVMQM